MTDPWPGDWMSGAEKAVRDRVEETSDLPAGENTGPSFTNDHGTRYMFDREHDTYLILSGNIPENTC